jgi:sugar-phosphatase
MTLPTRRYAAFLFDMDGTLLTSIAAAERAWTQWAQRHEIDPKTVIAAMHGVRAVETVRRFAPPGVDIDVETQLITEAEIADTSDVREVLGAAAFLARLPAGSWALVTSASRRLAEARLAAAGMELPSVIISSEDVERGKPAPDCFLAGARALGVDIKDCLVFEDTHAGITAAQAAGADVVVITATHHEPIDSSFHSLKNYSAVDIALDDQHQISLLPFCPS